MKRERERERERERANTMPDQNSFEYSAIVANSRALSRKFNTPQHSVSFSLGKKRQSLYSLSVAPIRISIPLDETQFFNISPKIQDLENVTFN